MFNLFKKKKPLDEQVQAVLDAKTLYGQPFMNFVVDRSLDGDILTMNMRIGMSDDTAEFEREYHALQQTLYPMGVTEVNINVSIAEQSIANAKDAPQDTAKIHKPIARIIISGAILSVADSAADRYHPDSSSRESACQSCTKAK